MNGLGRRTLIRLDEIGADSRPQSASLRMAEWPVGAYRANGDMFRMISRLADILSDCGCYEPTASSPHGRYLPRLPNHVLMLISWPFLNL